MTSTLLIPSPHIRITIVCKIPLNISQETPFPINRTINPPYITHSAISSPTHYTVLYVKKLSYKELARGWKRMWGDTELRISFFFSLFRKVAVLVELASRRCGEEFYRGEWVEKGKTVGEVDPLRGR